MREYNMSKIDNNNAPYGTLEDSHHNADQQQFPPIISKVTSMSTVNTANGSVAPNHLSLGSTDDEGQEVSLASDEGVLGLKAVPRKRKLALIIGVSVTVGLAITLGVVLAVVGHSFKDSPSSSADLASKGQFDFAAIASSNPTSTPETSTPTDGPTFTPSFQPSLVPTASPTNSPTDMSSDAPSDTPSGLPSANPTAGPTNAPTVALTSGPTSIPTQVPTPLPTRSPTRSPTQTPVITATMAPSYAPIGAMPVPTPSPAIPVDPSTDTLTMFCVIADVPYFPFEEVDLPLQIQNQMEGCEFLVHLGDIMSAQSNCDGDKYTSMRRMLNESAIPVFIVPGDNEWNDCGSQRRIDQSWDLWTQNFMKLEDNWQHNFGVVRQPGYPENFAFIHKKTLFVGLKVVGGGVHDSGEWRERHTAQIWWATELISHNVPDNAHGIVILAHAAPDMSKHSEFFAPLRGFMRDELDNQYPILYLHGDGHIWDYKTSFLNQRNILRVQHEGGTRDPVLKVLADPFLKGPTAQDAFQFDRQLELDMYP